MIVVANRRFDNAKSPAAMLQEKNARTPHTLRIADVVRTCIPQVGYLFSYFNAWYLVCCTRYVRIYSYNMYGRESTARHSSTAKTTKVKPKIPERKKNPRPLS